MRVRQSMAVLMAMSLVMASACTPGGPSADEVTEVRGVEIEREEPVASGPTEEPTSVPEVTHDTSLPRPPAVRSGEDPPQGGMTPAPPPPAPPPPAAPTPVPPPPPPAPDEEDSTDTSSRTVERPPPTAPPAETLAAGAGWGFATLTPGEDGASWTQTSGTPPMDDSGDTGYRSFTTVATSPVDGSEAHLDVGCPAWLAAPPEAGLGGRGTVTAELLAGGTVLASAVHGVEIDLAPGERSQDLPWGALVRVDAGDGESVTCRVRVDV